MGKHAVAFSHWCCKVKRGPSCSANVTGQAITGDCTVDLYSYNRRMRSNEVNTKYFQMDWWFAAAPATAASWLNISLYWESYAQNNKQLGIGNLWGHFIWAQHVHLLRAHVVYSSAVCGRLARIHLGDRRPESNGLCSEHERTRNTNGIQSLQCPSARRCQPVAVSRTTPMDGLNDGHFEHTFGPQRYSLGTVPRNGHGNRS